MILANMEISIIKNIYAILANVKNISSRSDLS